MCFTARLEQLCGNSSDTVYSFCWSDLGEQSQTVFYQKMRMCGRVVCVSCLTLLSLLVSRVDDRDTRTWAAFHCRPKCVSGGLNSKHPELEPTFPVWEASVAGSVINPTVLRHQLQVQYFLHMIPSLPTGGTEDVDIGCVVRSLLISVLCDFSDIKFIAVIFSLFFGGMKPLCSCGYLTERKSRHLVDLSSF